jgi:hypothetical protein
MRRISSQSVRAPLPFPRASGTKAPTVLRARARRMADRHARTATPVIEVDRRRDRRVARDAGI